MKRKINRMVQHLAVGEISDTEFIRMFRKEFFETRREDKDKLAKKSN